MPFIDEILVQCPAYQALKSKRFYDRYMDEGRDVKHFANLERLTLKDHILLLTQLAPIHELVGTTLIKRKLYDQMPVQVQELLYKSYAINKDIAKLTSVTKPRDIPLLPATELCANEIQEMILKSHDNELFYQFVANALLNLYDDQIQKPLLRQLLFRHIQGYEDQYNHYRYTTNGITDSYFNDGVTYFCQTRGLLARFNKFLEGYVDNKEEFIQGVNEAFGRIGRIYDACEVERHKVKTTNYCNFFTKTIGITLTVATTAALAYRYI